jgi:hypothetical protein
MFEIGLLHFYLHKVISFHLILLFLLSLLLFFFFPLFSLFLFYILIQCKENVFVL